tara:strand:+ start:6780 stop:7283 length:504 start_codon:yes stop_codon:yes gene_type:complete
MVKIILNEAEEETQEVLEMLRKEAHEMTIEDLPEFLDRLMNTYQHDYGTICHAISIGGIATMWALNHSEQGGITGFQAGAIMWENIRNWDSSYKNKPLMLMDYSAMLYPQHGDRFASNIDAETWEYLQKEAKANLEKENEHTSKTVMEHWQQIVDGKVPFGYKVVKE